MRTSAPLINHIFFSTKIYSQKTLQYHCDFLYRQCLSNALEYTLFHICTCPLPDLLNNTVVFLRQFCITQQNDSDSNKEYMVNPHCPNPQFYLEQ